MSYACGYVLSTHCDHPEHNRLYPTNGGPFYGNTKDEPFREAKLAGWAIDQKTQTAICPRCHQRHKGS